MKEFVIFIVLFTVFYILFFIVFDKVQILLLKKKIEKRAFSVMDVSLYLAFASFYGIQGTVDFNVMKDIFFKYQNESEINLSVESKKYNITAYEFAVIYLFFEYHNIFYKKMIDIEKQLISPVTFNDLSLVSKYQSCFDKHLSVDAISSRFGEITTKDLSYIDCFFLAPGVRFIDNQLYYVGDFYEKK